MLEHVAALVVVQHPGYRAAFDRGEHQQHRVDRVAQHDADDVSVADTASCQHRGVAVDGLVGLPVGELLVGELEEQLVAVGGGAVLEHLADGGLGRRPGPESGDHTAQNRRRVGDQAGYAGGDVEQSRRFCGFQTSRPSCGDPLRCHLSDTLIHAGDRHHLAGAQASSASSMTSVTTSRSNARSG